MSDERVPKSEDEAVVLIDGQQYGVRLLGNLQRVEVKAGDRFLLQTKQDISMETAERLRDFLSVQLGGAPVIVLGGDIQLSVLSQAAEPPQSQAGVAVMNQFTIQVTDERTAQQVRASLPEGWTKADSPGFRES